MSKIKDVLGVMKKVDSVAKLFGAGGDFMSELGVRTRKVGEAIMKEQGVNSAEAMKIPEETDLGKDAEQAFTELKEWLHEKDERF